MRLKYDWHIHMYIHTHTHTQELNSKAETKFNKLKAQAKSKIAALNKELERVKGEKGEQPSLNVSAQVNSVTVISPVCHTCIHFLTASKSGSCSHTESLGTRLCMVQVPSN